MSCSRIPVKCRWIRQEDRQETDLMSFSKSASPCDTDALTLTSLQTQDVKSVHFTKQPAVGKCV